MNAKGDLYGTLQAAAAKGRMEVVQLLLDGGAAVNTGAAIIPPPLQAASFGGHEKIVRLLLQRGADGA